VRSNKVTMNRVSSAVREQDQRFSSGIYLKEKECVN